MRELIFDIEAIPDPMFPPVAPPKEGERSEFRAPPYWQVVTIGCLLLEECPCIECAGMRAYRVVKVGNITGTEFDQLEKFAILMQDRKIRLVSFNGRGFDLPTIAARCFRYGIRCLEYYSRRDIRYRYSEEGHLDLMDFLADYGATRHGKLDAWAKLCGFPGKVGVDGSEVEGLVARGELEAVENYCLCDVVQTAAVFLRTELIKGGLTREGYVQSAQSLIEAVDACEKVQVLRPLIDRERFTLC